MIRNDFQFGSFIAGRAISTFIIISLMGSVHAELWEDATPNTIGKVAGWSNKVELADINGDGQVDILFANGGNYDSPGTPQFNNIFLNNGPKNKFIDATEAILGPTPDLARVIKVKDLNSDGYVDIFVGTTFETQSRLYLGNGKGTFTEVTATNLPQQVASIGDAEIGDIDGDGDLDLVLANWGPGSPMVSEGGRTKLWLNDGTGRFTDATETNMPDLPVGFSWEMELVDVDNDFDLDVVVSCKICKGSYLFHNDGVGQFTDASLRLPQFGNNYEFEAIDLTDDGFLDLVTINDGESARQHIFIADGTGGFTDGTESLIPKRVNLPHDDNCVVFLDADSDGDADFLVSSLGGPDRLLRNGGGNFTLEKSVFKGPPTWGTLGIAVADLDGDGRLDVVMSEGENAFNNRVFLGVDIPVDKAPPIIGLVEQIRIDTVGSDVTVHARVHDNKSPPMPHDLNEVSVVWSLGSGPEQTAAMNWYGEYLWRATLTDIPGTSIQYRVCAMDLQGNRACSDTFESDS